MQSQADCHGRLHITRTDWLWAKASCVKRLNPQSNEPSQETATGPKSHLPQIMVPLYPTPTSQPQNDLQQPQTISRLSPSVDSAGKSTPYRHTIGRWCQFWCLTLQNASRLRTPLGNYLFFFSFFNFRFSFGLSPAFFWFSFLPLSLFPPSAISASPF